MTSELAPPTQRPTSAEVHRRVRVVVNTLMMAGLDAPLGRWRISDCGSWRCRAHCTWRRWTGEAAVDRTWPVALRDALVRLGPAFVKIGQILSVRADLVPPDVATALRTLQSDVPPVPFTEVRQSIETELAMSLTDYFASVDEEPIAAGSVAQVHTARTLDGRLVALKVKRPEIDEVMELDLEVLLWLANQIELRSKAGREFGPVAAAQELKRYTLRELDFRQEAAIARRLREHHAGDERIVIPEVYHASRGLVVMDFIEGFPADDRAAYVEHDIDPHDLLHVGIQAVISQIFELGAFHADPHPGNLHVTATGKLVMLDFGIFGELDERLRRRCALAVWALVRGDVELASTHLVRMAHAQESADIRGFRSAVEEKYRVWRSSRVMDYGMGRLVFDVMSFSGRFGLNLPSDAILVGKALTTVEGLILWVDPDIDLNAEMQPYLGKVARQLFDPRILGQEITRALPTWWDLLEQAPLELAQRIEQGLMHERPRDDHGNPPVAPSGWLAGTGVLLIGFGAARLEPWFAIAVGVAAIAIAVLWRAGSK